MNYCTGWNKINFFPPLWNDYNFQLKISYICTRVFPVLLYFEKHIPRFWHCHFYLIKTIDTFKDMSTILNMHILESIILCNFSSSLYFKILVIFEVKGICPFIPNFITNDLDIFTIRLESCHFLNLLQNIDSLKGISRRHCNLFYSWFDGFFVYAFKWKRVKTFQLFAMNVSKCLIFYT